MMGTTLKDNPAYQLQGTFDGFSIYLPADIANYHMSRYVQLHHQLIYAQAGCTSERLQAIADEILKRCNMAAKFENRITDIGVLANEILYRLKYPVDEHVAIRVGALLTFVEWEHDYGEGKGVQVYTEDPDKYDVFYTSKKEQLALNNPDAYAFFLQWGVSNIEQYRQHFDTSISLDYFKTRRETLANLTPQ